MPPAKKPSQNERVIEFVKLNSNSTQYKDHYIVTNAGPILDRRLYCVEWGFDEDEMAEYWCYVAARIDNPSEMEYFDDETAMFHSLSTFSSQLDNNYRTERFRQYADLFLDIIAGLIALAITGTIIYRVICPAADDRELGQLWNIFAVIIGFYFGKGIIKKSEVS